MAVMTSSAAVRVRPALPCERGARPSARDQRILPQRVVFSLFGVSVDVMVINDNVVVTHCAGPYNQLGQAVERVRFAQSPFSPEAPATLPSRRSPWPAVVCHSARLASF